MAFTSLGRNASRKRRSAHQSTSLRRSTRLRSEQLEDRLVLTPFTVVGDVRWTDGAGSLHALPMAAIEVVEHDASGVAVIGTTETNAAGHYELSLDYDDGPSQGNPDVSVRVLARSRVADIKNPAGTATYAVESATVNEVPISSTQTLNVTAGNADDTGKAFGVHHALVLIGQYASTLAGSMPSQVDVRYGASITGSSVTFSTPPVMRIRGTAAYQWDVIHHEYGHYFQAAQGFVTSVGGSHGIYDNLADTKGSKINGLNMAWSEGWVTYFGISGQTLMGAAALGIAGVGDESYQGLATYNLETETGRGEDNELSVQTALWDVFDAGADELDLSQIGDRTLFTLFRDGSIKTIGAAWETLAARESTAGKARLGGVFAHNKIAPDLVEPADNAPLSNTAPTFRWLKNGGGTTCQLDDFRIRFYSNDFSRIIFEKELGNADRFTPTATEWNTIRTGDSVIKWVVEGRNQASPTTPGGGLGYYWSGARSLGGIAIVFVIDDTGSMWEEIDGVKTALQQFVDTVDSRLGPSDPRPTIQLITFKDDVTVRITSNDLAAVRAAVGSLYASGGGDCPEFSAQALAEAAENVARNGTVLLATDASSQPGVNMSAVIAKLRAKGVTLNTILSGDCGGIGGASEARASASQVDSPVVAGPTPKSSEFTPLRTSSESVGFLGGAYEPGVGGDGYEPPQAPFEDLGQEPLDDHGNSTETATTLLVNGSPVLGSVDDAGDADDYFTFSLKAGTRYSVVIGAVDADEYPGVYSSLLDGNGAFVDSQYSKGAMQVVPEVDGVYYLDVSAYWGGLQQYLVQVTDDPLAGETSAVALFSTASTLTNGTFLVLDEVNAGSTEAYVAAAYNVMVSTLGPAVLSANPGEAPQGQTLAVTLTGRNTNWRAGSTTVAFGDPGIVVQSVQIHSATSLTAVVQIAPTIATGRYDATVTTTLGPTTETASGNDVLQVVEATSEPMILSADPANLSQGDETTVVIRGANVAWDAAAVVNLGAGITVQTVRVISPTHLEVDVVVSPSAEIGYRTVTVTQGSDVVNRSRALFVNVAGVDIPEISSLSPATVGVGKQVDVTIQAANTHFQAGVTTADFGDGVQVVSVTVVSPTEAVVRVRAALNAAIGFRSVSLATGGEAAVLLQGFYVAPSAAGNVKAVVRNRTLFVTGDAQRNAVQFSRDARGRIVVTGLYGTKINKATRSYVAPATTRDVKVDLQGNADTLIVESITVKGKCDLALGVDGAADSVRVSGAVFKQSLAINTGKGNDEILVQGSKVSRNLAVAAGAGRDRIEISQTTAGAATLNLGADAAANQLEMTGCKVLGNLHVTAGSGNDVLRVADCSVRNTFFASLASGADTLSLDELRVAGLANILAGRGADKIEIGCSSDAAFGLDAKRLTLDAGDDKDGLDVRKSAIGGMAKIVAGSGDDGLSMSGNTAIELQVLLGTGNDSFDASGGNNQIQKKTQLDGGAGQNQGIGLDVSTNLWGTLRKTRI